MRLVRNLNQQMPEKRWNRKIRETREGLQLQIRKEKEHVLYLGPGGGGGGGDRSEAWDGETMFSRLAKRSSQNVDSGVRNNTYFRST